MKSLYQASAFILLLAAVSLTGCKEPMVISKVDYSQSVESVLSPNDQGVVDDVQQGLKFNILPLQYIETQDTSRVTTKQVRYIRGDQGFYYITAPDYSNVYVMRAGKGKLKLKKKLKISEKGIDEPAFNQRDKYVQLLNRASGETWQIYPDRVQQGKSQMAKDKGE